MGWSLTKLRVLPVLLGLSLAPPQSEGCECLKIGERDNHLALGEYGTVFRGEVLSIRWVFVETADGSNRIVRAVVVETSSYWKGAVAPVNVVYTGMGCGDCGFDFQVGSEYIVFTEPVPRDLRTPLNVGGSGLWTDICTPTGPVEEASSVIETLDELITSQRHQAFESIEKMSGLAFN